MKKHGKFFVPNIVLGIILFFVIIANIFLPVFFSAVFTSVGSEGEMAVYEVASKETTESEYIYNNWYSMLTMKEINAEYIGWEYEGRTAREGYDFYKITAKVQNDGNLYHDTNYVYIYFKGESYDNLIEEDNMPDEEMTELTYYNQVIIPPCLSADVVRILQVKEGTKVIQAEFYENMEAKQYVITLNKETNE